MRIFARGRRHSMIQFYTGWLFCVILAAEAARGSLDRLDRLHRHAQSSGNSLVAAKPKPSPVKTILSPTKLKPAPIKLKPAPIKPKTLPITTSSLCSSRDDFRFQRSVLLTFNGRPGKLTDAQIAMLQREAIQAYNQAAACKDIPGGFLSLSQVTISRNEVNSFGSTVSLTVSANVTQKFTVVATFEGSCRGCSTTAFRLFGAPPPKQRERTLAVTYSKNSLAGDRGGAGGTKKDTSDDRKKPPPKLCKCPVPSESAFLAAFNKLMLPPSVDMLVDVTELTSYSPCASVETTFETFITINFIGGLDNVTNLQSQYQLLQQAVLQSYNDLNALNTKDVCDTFFVTLTDVQIVVGLGSAGYGLTSMNRRWLQTSSVSTFNRNLVAKVRGTCRGCSSNQVSVYNDGIKKSRQLITNLGTAEEVLLEQQIDESTLADGAIDVSTSLSFHDRRHLRRLPVIAGKCFCPVTATKFRLPTRSEFVNALNNRLGVLEGAGLINIVGNATDTIQDVPVNCTANITFFEDTITVQIDGLSTNLTQAQITQLTQGFATSYNGLAQQFCDPFFRTVDSVQLVKVESSRMLFEYGSVEDSDNNRGLVTTTTSSIIVKVRGRCRGCTKSVSLYNDGITKSRILLDPMSVQHEFVSTVNNPSSAQRGRDQQYRVLQQTNQTNQCFCYINSQGNRAPTKAEFVAAYNQTVASSNISLTVTTIVEQNVTTPAPSTLSPTRKPTPCPTTRKPTPSPTHRPTSTPTYYTIRPMPPSVSPSTIRPMPPSVSPSITPRPMPPSPWPSITPRPMPPSPWPSITPRPMPPSPWPSATPWPTSSPSESPMPSVSTMPSISPAPSTSPSGHPSNLPSQYPTDSVAPTISPSTVMPGTAFTFGPGPG